MRQLGCWLQEGGIRRGLVTSAPPASQTGLGQAVLRIRGWVMSVWAGGRMNGGLGE